MKVHFSGLSNCSWTSCREGCTRDYFECFHIKVEYSKVGDDSSTFNKGLVSLDSSTHVASLFVNVKGCGYPPAVQCDKWLADFGVNNSVVPCFYSKNDNSMAITHLDTERAKNDVLLSILLPFLLVVLSGAALFLVCKYFGTKSKPKKKSAR